MLSVVGSSIEPIGREVGYLLVSGSPAAALGMTPDAVLPARDMNGPDSLVYISGSQANGPGFMACLTLGEFNDYV